MPETETLESTGVDIALPTQVILYNDDVHSFAFVIRCLMAVFSHSAEMAAKIACEADRRGRAIAEVEPREEATLHAAMLVRFGLRAEVEEI